MEIVIQSRNIKVTDGLNNYVRRKLEKLDRYLPNIVEVRVELEHEHTRRGEDLAVAQITVRHQRGALLRAQETVPGEIENAINLAIDKMYRQIQRFKGKRVRKGRERFAATLEELGIAEAIPNVEVDGDVQSETESEQEAQVIRRKNVEVAAMSEDEAIEQMELLGHTFFIFFNQALGAVNVVYKRRAGGYGVLNPQVE